MKSFIIGFGCLVVASVIALILRSLQLFNILTGALGFGALIISAITSREFSGHQKIGESLENPKERLSRIDLQLKSFLIGLPSLIACIAGLYIQYR